MQVPRYRLRLDAAAFAALVRGAVVPVELSDQRTGLTERGEVILADLGFEAMLRAIHAAINDDADDAFPNNQPWATPTDCEQ